MFQMATSGNGCFLRACLLGTTSCWPREHSSFVQESLRGRIGPRPFRGSYHVLQAPPALDLSSGRVPLSLDEAPALG